MDISIKTSCEKKDTFKKKRSKSFSRVLAIIVVLGTRIDNLIIFYLAYICIINQYLGELLFLGAIVAANDAAMMYVLKKYYEKSQAENTKGGIIYDSQLGNRDPTEI